MSNRINIRKQLSGKVISTAMDKTIVVNVIRSYPHKKYNKYIKKTKRYYAHDSLNNCQNGDTVLIEESKPISKLKRWTVKKITKKAVS